MAGNFWQSSHCNQWILTPQDLTRERAADFKVLTEVEYNKVMIFYANVIQAIGEQLKLRQQVIATATVYFKRFYCRHPLRSCDPLLLAPTCIFLAAKVEESGVVSNSRLIAAVGSVIKNKFGHAFQMDYNYRITSVWECEFFLLELMDCCLIVYHPYRPLLQYVSDIGHADLLLPVAWRIVNDTYRTDVILLYPPFQIALACLHIACVIQSQLEVARQWFADLNVDMEKIIEITKIILQLYDLWKNYNEKEEISSILEKVPKACVTPSDYNRDDRMAIKGKGKG
ncbi:cyclin-C-like [Styela clava]|uniref:cyclin-C-like n=1 Tax=Styela clava TaxID=7725 RepID=UPI00193AB162|nr:cyclin-C-like [Styela clava]